jgi:peptidoglycan/LPS O-acetylase OafA/YrhL
MENVGYYRGVSFGPGALRILLAAAVFLSHVSRFDFGRPAVMIFFMLSGYWVARMQDGPHHQSYEGYIVSRFFRIWPLLAVTAILTSVAYSALGLQWPGSLASTIALLGLATRKNDIVGTVWSLDIEMQFYIILPLLLVIRSFFNSLRRLILISLSAFVTGCAAVVIFGLSTVFLYFPMFAAGLFIYVANWTVGGRAALWSALIGTCALSTLAAPYFGYAHLTQFERDIGFMMASLLLVPFVSWNVRQPSHHFDRAMGNLSYPFYLVHEPILHLCLVFWAGFLAKIAALTASVIATGCLYFAVDRPVEMLRKLIRMRADNAVQT